MPLLGAHMSIAGGYHKAVDAAAALGMTTVQIFTKNNSQWKAKPITADESDRFAMSLESSGIQKPCAHASYLINLASPDPELWQKSVDAFAVELDRAEQLGLSGVVIHPGTAKGCDEAAGVENVIRALNMVLQRSDSERVEIWLETTAGQGACLGYRFEHLARMIGGVDDPSRIGVCLDTCHLFAAGYPLIDTDEYAATMTQLETSIGLNRLRAVHLNDSKKPFGSRVDRHEHIGEGHLGREPFRHFLNDVRFADIPMYLETPKGNRDGLDLDAINLETLRSLMKPAEQTDK